jgi:regulatory protein
MMARADLKPKSLKKGPADAPGKKPSLKRPAKLPTKRRLNNIALFYLKRFSSTAENLRQVLRRRVLKMTHEKPELRADAYAAIDEIVAGFVANGAIDDARYAASKVRFDQVMKKPKAKTAAKLRAKGVAAATIKDALETESMEDADFQAGLAIARRRRIGPYRTTERTRETDQKDLAVLARGGLDFATAKRVLNWTDDQDR